jgi:hypothetical protein
VSAPSEAKQTSSWNGVLLLPGVLLESRWAGVVLLLERSEPVAWLLVVVGVSMAHAPPGEGTPGGRRL